MKRIFPCLVMFFLVVAPAGALTGIPGFGAVAVMGEPVSVSYLNAMAAAMIPFALIHLALFFYVPQVRTHLYVALTAMASIPLGFALGQGGGVFEDPLVLISFALVGLAGVRLLYALFVTEVPVQFEWFAGCFGLGGTMWAVVAYGFREKSESWNPMVRAVAEQAGMIVVAVVTLIVLVEMVRVLLGALRVRADGGWIVAGGMVLLLGGVFAAFGVPGIPEIAPELRIQLPFLGVAAFVLSGSAFLARQFGRMHRELMERTAELAVAKQRLEGAWQRADAASQAKTVILKNLNQELRSPVESMIECAKALRREPNLPEDQRGTIQTLEKSGRSLLKMIDDMLDLSRFEVSRVESQNVDFDLGVLIEGLIALFRVRCREKQLLFRVEWDAPATAETGRRFGEIEHDAATHAADSRSRLPSIPVNGDEGKLKHVLACLLENAVKFTDRGSIKLRISFFASLEFAKREAGAPGNRPGAKMIYSGESGSGNPFTGGEISASGAPSMYRFEVIDTGPGLSHGAQLRLFEPFQQEVEGLKRGGIGVGLALARRHVELLGGNLRVQSELGKGSRFYFDVPLKPGKPSPELPHASPAKEISRLAPGYSVRALVVDDVRENRDVLTQFLSGIGCLVREAENANQALALLREELPQIVFMDIRMPGMWGDEAFQRIAAEFGDKKPRMVAISASALAQEREAYMKVGFDEFLSKPVRFYLLCDALRRLLNVEFEYVENAADNSRLESAPDPENTRIPGYARELLRQAAGSSNVPKLEKALQELEKIGDKERDIAVYLRRLVQQGQLEGVVKFLSKVKAR